MNECPISSISDEFEASLQMGSGLIGVAGPPGSGKTRSVLDFLSEREERHRLEVELSSCLSRRNRGAEQESKSIKHCEPLPALRACHVEYWSARSLSNDVISQLVHRIQRSLAFSEDEERENGTVDADLFRGGTRRKGCRSVLSPAPGLKRRRLDLPVSELSSAITAWLTSHARGSELHLVIDDADHLNEDNAVIDRWLSGCLLDQVSCSRSVFLWLVSQVPRRLPSCFRWHLLGLPTAATMSAWVASDFRAEGDVSVGEDVLRQCVCHAVQHYRTQRPSATSLIVKDIRTLLQRVYDRLPALLELATPNTGGTATSESNRMRLPNALQYAKAWASTFNYSSSDAGVEDEASADLLCRALQRVGHTAVLLAFSAFYCGAVSKQQQQRALGDTAESVRRTTHRRQNTRSTGAAGNTTGLALSSSAFTFTATHLAAVYRALLPMCTVSIEPMEFETASWACAHLLPRLLSWGLITTAARTQSISYHCWIPMTTAVQLSTLLGISLYQLIPV